MTAVSDDIWAGDHLDRKAEAVALERFLDDETDFLAKAGRGRAYVLALDAAYGEGKSWFLERFAKQLAVNHPVATVDAWADDATDEPLISLIAAVEDTLKPYLKKGAMQDKLVAARNALVPMMGKAAVAFGTKFAAKHFGEELGDELKGMFGSGLDNEALAAGGEKLTEAVSAAVETLIDRKAEKMLSDYRDRRKSSKFFKEQLAALVASLGDADKQAPVYIIIDELDRCRPSYAIKMLEEIKHIFDVPGLAFIIAVHSGQLAKSVKAIYGHEFDADSYLQRFHTRRYQLRKPSIMELTRERFRAFGYTSEDFTYPPFPHEGKFDRHAPDILVGLLMSYWRVSPRQFEAVLDCFRVFKRQWNYPVAIELPLALNLMVQWVLPHIYTMKPIGLELDGEKFVFQFPGRESREIVTAEPNQLTVCYAEFWRLPLSQATRNQNGEGMNGYVQAQLQTEFTKVYRNSSHGDGSPYSIWKSYPSLIENVGRMIGKVDGAVLQSGSI